MPGKARCHAAQVCAGVERGSSCGAAQVVREPARAHNGGAMSKWKGNHVLLAQLKTAFGES